MAGMGPGISVAELLATTGEGPFLVNGYAFVGTDGSVVIAASTPAPSRRICRSALASSGHHALSFCLCPSGRHHGMSWSCV